MILCLISSSQFYSSMQHLLRLLNLPLKPIEQNRTLPPPLRAERHSQRRPVELSSTDPLGPQRRSHSLQNHAAANKNNSALRVKGVSHSLRLPLDFQQKNQSIRISKHSYRISRHPTTSSEITISNKLTINHTEIAEIIQHSSKKMTTINVGPEFQQKQNILNRRKAFFREKQEGREERQTLSKEKRKVGSRKFKMLTMVGTGCKIFDLMPIINKKQSEGGKTGTFEA